MSFYHTQNKFKDLSGPIRPHMIWPLILSPASLLVSQPIKPSAPSHWFLCSSSDPLWHSLYRCCSHFLECLHPLQVARYRTCFLPVFPVLPPGHQLRENILGHPTETSPHSTLSQPCFSPQQLSLLIDFYGILSVSIL